MVNQDKFTIYNIIYTVYMFQQQQTATFTENSVTSVSKRSDLD